MEIEKSMETNIHNPAIFNLNIGTYFLIGVQMAFQF